MVSWAIPRHKDISTNDNTNKYDNGNRCCSKTCAYAHACICVNQTHKLQGGQAIWLATTLPFTKTLLTWPAYEIFVIVIFTKLKGVTISLHVCVYVCINPFFAYVVVCCLAFTTFKEFLEQFILIKLYNYPIEIGLESTYENIYVYIFIHLVQDLIMFVPSLNIPRRSHNKLVEITIILLSYLHWVNNLVAE